LKDLGQASLAVIACCLGCSGCTLVGMGIGATVPRYEPMSTPSSVEDCPAGTKVSMKMVDGTSIDGTVVSQPYPLVVRDYDTGKSTTVDTPNVQVAERKVGTWWGTGALVGATVDVAVILIGAMALSTRGTWGPSFGPGP